MCGTLGILPFEQCRLNHSEMKAYEAPCACEGLVGNTACTMVGTVRDHTPSFLPALIVYIRSALCRVSRASRSAGLR
ncbi:hypothetical protein D9M68_941570 [compost metagenome]